jgi:hypothetical protein
MIEFAEWILENADFDANGDGWWLYDKETKLEEFKTSKQLVKEYERYNSTISNQPI